MLIKQLPPVLVLHIKRFLIGTNVVYKNTKHLSFPNVLNMAPYCTNECTLVRTSVYVNLISFVFVCHSYILYQYAYMFYICNRILENSSKSKSHMKSSVFLHVFNDISTYVYVFMEYFLHSFSNLNVEFLVVL